MLRNQLALPGLLLSAVLVNVLFWDEKVALNLVLFGLLAGIAILALRKGAIAHTNVRITAAGTLLAGLFVLLYASDISRWAFILSFGAFLGFANSPEMRSLPLALFTGFMNFFTGWTGFATALGEARAPRVGRLKPARIIAISALPIGLLFLFGLLFSQANPRFGKLFQVITVDFADALLGLLDGLHPLRVVLLGFGLFLSVGLLFHYRWRKWESYDAHTQQTLQRRRRKRNRPFQVNGLRREQKIALLTIVSINLLTLVNNVLDIDWIWINFEYDGSVNLTQFVHEGTYLLIASILLAMFVMFYFWRGNLNFLRQNKALRIASYVWIAQNLVMVVSVGLRNYHYISEWGLAYKRIGVFFFLALTAFGLVTLFLKIYRRKTLHHVVRVNAWATYAVLLLLAAVNWDQVITSYNFSRQLDNGIDVQFHMDMSDKVLPLLDQRRDLIADKMVPEERYFWNEYQLAENVLDRRIEKFKLKMEKRSWLSWNLADARAMSYFRSQNED